MTLQNEKFEEMLAGRLSKELEPQRGKALAAFRAQMANPVAAPLVMPVKARRNLALWAGVPSLMAACVAVVVTLHFAGGQAGPVKPVDPVAVATVPGVKSENVAKVANTGNLVFDAPADQLVVTQNIPGGVILSDGTPLRVVRQQEIRQTHWIDPSDHSSMILTEPTEKVGYIQVHPD